MLVGLRTDLTYATLVSAFPSFVRRSSNGFGNVAFMPFNPALSKRIFRRWSLEVDSGKPSLENIFGGQCTVRRYRM